MNVGTRHRAEPICCIGKNVLGAFVFSIMDCQYVYLSSFFSFLVPQRSLKEKESEAKGAKMRPHKFSSHRASSRPTTTETAAPIKSSKLSSATAKNSSRRQAVLGPKKGARTIAPRKQVLVRNKGMVKVLSYIFHINHHFLV
jgi:hypothetical protein